MLDCLESNPVRGKNFSSLHSVQIETGAHPALSLGCEGDCSPPSGTEAKNGGAVSTFPIRLYWISA
jgi:hypothetical protein